MYFPSSHNLMCRLEKSFMRSVRGPVFISCCLLFLFLSPHASARLPQTLEAVKKGVVAVGLLVPVKGSPKSPPQARYLGTGFAVKGGELVVTNHHVVSKKTKAGERLAVFSGRGRQARVHQVEVIRSDPEHDLALLRIVPPLAHALRLRAPEWVAEGSDVAFTGFPLGMALGLYPVTHKGIVAAITPAAIPANSSRELNAARIKRLRNPFMVYQLDAVAYPGNSGSPVYLPSNGEVIGVVNSVFVKGSKESVLSTPSGITYAIPVRHVHELLK